MTTPTQPQQNDDSNTEVADVGSVRIVPAARRFHTQLDWLDSYHCFNFGPHTWPRDEHHGLLLVSNDDRVRGGSGFGTHPHQNMEIVTWVLRGELRHKDSTGTDGIIYPGLAQRMSAGSGIRHSEMNASATAEVHLIQMWVPPDTDNIEPSYEQADVSSELALGSLVKLAAGDGTGAVAIQQRDAACYVGELRGSATIELPVAAAVHLYVATGSGTLVGVGQVNTGDAARCTNAPAQSFTADPDGAHVVVWATAHGLPG